MIMNNRNEDRLNGAIDLLMSTDDEMANAALALLRLIRADKDTLCATSEALEQMTDRALKNMQVVIAATLKERAE